MIIYILSCGHSGSTLLDIMLSSSINGCVGIGEFYTFLKRVFYGRVDVKDHVCACGKNVLECEFWSKHLKCALLNNNYFDILNCLKINSNSGVLVDSSKDLALLSHVKDHDILVIHLIRSPFGVVNSYLRKYGRNKKNLMRFLIYWLWFNIKAFFIVRKFKRKTVFYENYVRYPLSTINYVLKDKIRDYIRPHIDLKKSHQIEGNRLRLKDLDTLKYDERWRKELSLLDKLLIFVLTFPLYMLFYKWLWW